MNIKIVNDLAQVPKYHSVGAAGFDLHSTERVVIMPGDITIIGTGLCFEIPIGKEIQIRPRSGMSAKTKIRVSNAPGTIDSDYTGEVKIILDNIGLMPYTVEIGDRIAQGVVCDVQQVNFTVVEELKTTERGAGGLGSSGV